MEYEIYPVDELRHWGVKGMRWGVRRYQNRDGTLTPAGKKRYDKELEKLKAEEKMLKNQERTKAKLDKLEELRKSNEARRNNLGEGKKTEEKKLEPPKLERKSVKDMSDEEIMQRKARLQLEKDYKDLLNQTRDTQINKAKSFVENIISKSGENLGTQIINHYGAKGLNAIIGAKDKDGNVVDVIFANNKKKS